MAYQNSYRSQSKKVRRKSKYSNTHSKPIKTRTYPEGAIPYITTPDTTTSVVSEMSGEVIQDPYTALYDSVQDKVVSFEEAAALIREREDIKDDEILLYGGKGEFVVVGYDKEEGKKKQVVRRRISFEDTHEELEWRDSLKYELSLPYEPKPYALSDLYTDKEISEFPLNKK